jgi:hypothetical protein
VGVLVSGCASTVKGEVIDDFLVLLVEALDRSLASANTDWLSVVMISDLVESSVEFAHIEGRLDQSGLHICWFWASFGTDGTEGSNSDGFEHF